MRRLLCTWMLMVFALTVALPGAGALIAPPSEPAAGESIVHAQVAKTYSRCCADQQVGGQSDMSRCASDCFFSLSGVPPLLIPAVQPRPDRRLGTGWPRYTGAVFRPPIA